MTSKEFIAKKVKDIPAEGLKVFPDDFLISCEVTSLDLPQETLIIGNQFFGSYEVLTAKGSSFCQAESLTRAKYIVYAGKQKNKMIKIPLNEKDIETAVKNYEKYLDDLLRQIKKEYRVQFPDVKEIDPTINEIFRLLNLSRL